VYRNRCRGFAVLLCLLAARPAAAQPQAAHLTIYDAGIAQFLEERTVQLEPGMNHIEWRSLMPRTVVRTLRVSADGAEVVRQEIAYDGPEVRGQRAPVLRLTLRNRGGARTARVQVDYLAPDLSWAADYSLVLDATRPGEPPPAALLDAWVSLYNQTGTDVRAGTVDLVAGEISLLSEGGVRLEDRAAANVSQASMAPSDGSGGGLPGAEGGSLSAFSRFRLGRDIALNSSVPIGRYPLFQGVRIPIVQRNVFENDHGTQTTGRGGFVLLPRGLEVRLVSVNRTGSALPAGQVTVYAREDGPPQVVGQDRIPITPPGAEFTVSQGRSATLFGTRRILDRRAEEYRTEQGNTRTRLITRVEVVISNRGPRAAEALVREEIEPHGENEWRIVESSAPVDRLSANTLQARLQVPAGGEVAFTYTVETK
jgi:hypothetical protein